MLQHVVLVDVGVVGEQSPEMLAFDKLGYTAARFSNRCVCLVQRSCSVPSSLKKLPQHYQADSDQLK